MREKDIRIPLKEGVCLKQGDTIYEIQDVFSAGGNALIYNAKKMEYGEETSVLLKEVYPYVNGENWFARKETGEVVLADPTNERAEARLYHARQDLIAEAEKGRRLREVTFLICPIEYLWELYFADSGEIARGFAEIDLDMNGSGILLSERMNALDKEYEGRIPLSVSLPLVKQIAATMEKIHNAFGTGYLYCDFSPGNVFLLKDTDEAVFIDMASAQPVGADGIVHAEAALPTTRGYRAPEAASERRIRKLRKTSDVYSLMTVFYQLVTGERFAGQDAESEFDKAMFPEEHLPNWKRIKEIEVRNPAVAYMLDLILKEGLEYRWKNRIQDFEQWGMYVEQLEKYMDMENDLFASLCELELQVCDRPLLEQVFVNALPDKILLRRAIDDMDEALHRSRRRSDISFVFEWLYDWFLKSDFSPETPEIEKKRLQLSYCGIAVANHCGEYSLAIQFYNECMKHTHMLSLDDYLDMQLRVAVSHENIFEFELARRMVESNLEILRLRKEQYRVVARKYGLDEDASSRFAIYGKNASAAGRYCAFLGRYEEADSLFREAMEEFKYEASNRERTGNYLWGLSVTMGDRDLFGKFCRKYTIRETISQQLEELLKNPEGQKVYHLLVFLKGLRKWYAGQLGEEICRMLEALADYGLWEKNRTGEHPWQLIFRCAALLLAEEKGEISETVKTLFARSLEVTKATETEAEEESVISVMRVLHLMTEAYLYQTELRFGQKASGEAVRQRLDKKTDEIFHYFQDCKCPLLAEDEWKPLSSPMEKMDYLVKKINYEYA